MLGVREVIIALDKQYETIDSDECKKWAKHIKDKIIDKTSVNYWFIQKQLLLLPSENLTSGV